jgi:hypothetical protein
MEVPSNEYYWQSGYSSYSGLTLNPYRFSIADPTTSDNLMAEYLTGKTRTNESDGEDWFALQLGTNDTQRVARAMEANFDMATLFAFARAPHAALLEITTTLEDNIWTYDTAVLAILALPLLATNLVLCIGWKVQSAEVVIGYDPLEIARRADEVLTPSLGAMTQNSGGKDLRSSSSSGAYSALEARPPSLAAGDAANVVGDFAETSPLRGSRLADSDERHDGLGAPSVHRGEYERNQNAGGVISEQEHPATGNKVDGQSIA